MARRKQSVGDGAEAQDRLNTNQVVAANFRSAREEAGWTQDFVASRLTEITGRKYTKATISAMERSADNDRRRLFDAHELVEMAYCFDLPVTWFLTPLPEHCEQRLDITGQEHGINVLDFVYGSSAGRLRYRDRLRELVADGHAILSGAAKAGFEEQSKAAAEEIMAAETPDLIKQLLDTGTQAVEVASKLIVARSGKTLEERLGEPVPSPLDQLVQDAQDRINIEPT